MSNWPLYIDIDEKTKKRPTLDQFTDDTGVKVDYIEDVNDNDEWFGKNRAALSQGQSIDRDITVLTDWMAGRMVRLGYVEKLDKSAIPNMSNLVDTLASPSFDPNREYTLPWQSGMTGIGFDPDRAGEVTSIEQLLEDPKLKGKVTFLTEMPDTMGLLLQLDGADPGDFTTRSGTRRSRGCRRRSTRARSGSSPATTTRACSRRATSGPARPGRATWCSCSSTTRT